MDDIAELNERFAARYRETLRQLDDIEAKLAGLQAAIARSTEAHLAPAMTAVTAAHWRWA